MLSCTKKEGKTLGKAEAKALGRVEMWKRQIKFMTSTLICSPKVYSEKHGKSFCWKSIDASLSSPKPEKDGKFHVLLCALFFRNEDRAQGKAANAGLLDINKTS